MRRAIEVRIATDETAEWERVTGRVSVTVVRAWCWLLRRIGCVADWRYAPKTAESGAATPDSSAG